MASTALAPISNRVVWYQDNNMIALVRKTSFKDCNATEFDEAVAVARDLGLSPLRKQIYAFVFSKTDPKKRNMVLVIGIDGGRSIAARSGNYRPDNEEPRWVFKDELKNPLTNPHGIEKCTVGVMYRPTKNDPFERIINTVYWEEFAPIVSAPLEEDAYIYEDTGETWPDGNPKKRKKLRPGATLGLRLDPKKDAWIKAGRNQIAKCAEMGALRKGWPDDLARIYAEEETDKARILDDVEYTDVTPSAMADAAEAEKRQNLIGGPSLFAVLDNSGKLERIPIGQYADKILAATEGLTPAGVADIVERNTESLKEFWAHNKTDALALKKVLEERARGMTAAKPAQAGKPAQEARPAAQAETKSTIPTKAELLASLEKVESKLGCLHWAQANEAAINALNANDRAIVDTAFQNKQKDVPN